jgi:hypothetical protein
MTKIGGAEFMQMSVSLIQSLQHSVCVVLQACDLAEEHDIVPCNEQHAPTLGAFALGAMLRAINPYVSSLSSASLTTMEGSLRYHGQNSSSSLRVGEGISFGLVSVPEGR